LTHTVGLNEPCVFVYKPLQKKTKSRRGEIKRSIPVIKTDASPTPWNDASLHDGVRAPLVGMGTTVLDNYLRKSRKI